MSLKIDNVHFRPSTPNRPFNGQSSILEGLITFDVLAWIEFKVAVWCSGRLKTLSKVAIGSRIKRISGQYIARYPTVG
jgi:hypothetical protein